jgi:hypothetical protein
LAQLNDRKQNASSLVSRLSAASVTKRVFPSPGLPHKRTLWRWRDGVASAAYVASHQTPIKERTSKRNRQYEPMTEYVPRSSSSLTERRTSMGSRATCSGFTPECGRSDEHVPWPLLSEVHASNHANMKLAFGPCPRGAHLLNGRVSRRPPVGKTELFPTSAPAPREDSYDKGELCPFNIGRRRERRAQDSIQTPQ